MDMNMDYKEAIRLAIKQLRSRDFSGAKVSLGTAFCLDDSGSEVQNILGAYYEMKGLHQKALSHYRAAYALDPSNIYATQNIERLVMGLLNQHSSQILYGDEFLQNYEVNKSESIGRDKQCTQS